MTCGGDWWELSVENKWRSSVTLCETLALGRRWPKGSERLFSYVDLRNAEIAALWRSFEELGTCRVSEILGALGLEQSSFAMKLFGLLGYFGGKKAAGAVDFESFVLCNWNLNSIPETEVAFFLFELYDTDGSGFLSFAELNTLVIDLTPLCAARAPRTARLLQDLRTLCDKEKSLSKQAFHSFCFTRPLFLGPALLLRDRMRQRFCGRKFWDAISKRRDQRAATQDLASKSATTFVVLRSLAINRQEEENPENDEPPKKTASTSLAAMFTTSNKKKDCLVEEAQRHRSLKAKSVIIDAALKNRTVSLATRSGTTSARGLENPLAMSLRQRKLAASDFCEALKRCAEESVKDANIINRNFLDDRRLTKDMRRHKSLQEDQRNHAKNRHRLESYIQRQQQETFRRQTTDDDDDTREESCVDDDDDSKKRREEKSTDDTKSIQVSAAAEGRRRRARGRWEKIRQRAKTAYARILADRRDDEREARQHSRAAPRQQERKKNPFFLQKTKEGLFRSMRFGKKQQSAKNLSRGTSFFRRGGPAPSPNDDQDLAHLSTVMNSKAGRFLSGLLRDQSIRIAKSTPNRRVVGHEQLLADAKNTNNPTTAFSTAPSSRRIFAGA